MPDLCNVDGTKLTNIINKDYECMKIKVKKEDMIALSNYFNNDDDIDLAGYNEICIPKILFKNFIFMMTKQNMVIEIKNIKKYIDNIRSVTKDIDSSISQSIKNLKKITSIQNSLNLNNKLEKKTIITYDKTENIYFNQISKIIDRYEKLEEVQKFIRVYCKKKDNFYNYGIYINICIHYDTLFKLIHIKTSKEKTAVLEQLISEYSINGDLDSHYCNKCGEYLCNNDFESFEGFTGDDHVIQFREEIKESETIDISRDKPYTINDGLKVLISNANKEQLFKKITDTKNNENQLNLCLKELDDYYSTITSTKNLDKYIREEYLNLDNMDKKEKIEKIIGKQLITSIKKKYSELKDINIEDHTDKIRCFQFIYNKYIKCFSINWIAKNKHYFNRLSDIDMILQIIKSSKKLPNNELIDTIQKCINDKLSINEIYAFISILRLRCIEFGDKYNKHINDKIIAKLTNIYNLINKSEEPKPKLKQIISNTFLIENVSGYNVESIDVKKIEKNKLVSTNIENKLVLTNIGIIHRTSKTKLATIKSNIHKKLNNQIHNKLFNDLILDFNISDLEEVSDNNKYTLEKRNLVKIYNRDSIIYNRLKDKLLTDEEVLDMMNNLLIAKYNNDEDYINKILKCLQYKPYDEVFIYDKLSESFEFEYKQRLNEISLNDKIKYLGKLPIKKISNNDSLFDVIDEENTQTNKFKYIINFIKQFNAYLLSLSKNIITHNIQFWTKNMFINDSNSILPYNNIFSSIISSIGDIVITDKLFNILDYIKQIPKNNDSENNDSEDRYKINETVKLMKIIMNDNNSFSLKEILELEPLFKLNYIIHYLESQSINQTDNIINFILFNHHCFNKRIRRDKDTIEAQLLNLRFAEDEAKKERFRNMEKVAGLQELYKLHREFGIGNIFVGDHIENPDVISIIDGQNDIMIANDFKDNPSDELLMTAGYDDDNQYTNDDENNDDRNDDGVDYE